MAADSGGLNSLFGFRFFLEVKEQKCLPILHCNFLEISIMKNKKYVLDLLKSENEQLRKMHEIIEKALAEETLITTTIQDTEEERSYGEKLSDKVAQFGGSWKFIIIFGVILMLWILYNTQVMHNQSFDPYPYIILNLILSCIAAIQAPIIMMSQNRKEVKDRKRSINDYMINLKSEIEIRNLHEKVDLSVIDQYKHLCDIQQKQLELLEELNKKVKLLSKPSNLS